MTTVQKNTVNSLYPHSANPISELGTVDSGKGLISGISAIQQAHQISRHNSNDSDELLAQAQQAQQ